MMSSILGSFGGGLKEKSLGYLGAVNSSSLSPSPALAGEGRGEGGSEQSAGQTLPQPRVVALGRPTPDGAQQAVYLWAGHRPHDRGGVLFREPGPERTVSRDPRYELSHALVSALLHPGPEGRHVGVHCRSASNDVVDRPHPLDDLADAAGERGELAQLVPLRVNGLRSRAFQQVDGRVISADADIQERLQDLALAPKSRVDGVDRHSRA